MIKEKPELSKKNQYWIERHRYYELRHFCLQYPIWRAAKDSVSAYHTSLLEERVQTDTDIRMLERTLLSTENYTRLIQMIESACKALDPGLETYILKAVTEDLSYTYLSMHYDLPFGKDLYFKNYRKFFWVLNKIRD